MERIELPTDDYKTPVLPLNYTGIFLERARGLEPLMLAWKASVLANYTMLTYLNLLILQMLNNDFLRAVENYILALYTL